jgi:hypothetical protein
VENRSILSPPKRCQGWSNRCDRCESLEIVPFGAADAACPQGEKQGQGR